MDLLSPQDWLDTRSALEDVKDTFFKFPVTYRNRTTRKLTNFHENREADLDYVDYPLFGLKVADKTDDDSKGREMPKGSVDLAEGVIYFSFQKLLAHVPPFIDADKKCTFIMNKDSLIFEGEEHTIIGINNVGPTESDFQLVKVQYKKQLQK